MKKTKKCKYQKQHRVHTQKKKPIRQLMNRQCARKQMANHMQNNGYNHPLKFIAVGILCKLCTTQMPRDKQVSSWSYIISVHSSVSRNRYETIEMKIEMQIWGF